MSARYTQPKAETQRHSEILKAMLKQPENKLCADCKRNDPRWASTNLGMFMCIRCSGIHRGLGVHITRIKSVDLDTWSPEQIALIQRWGNRRANLYWEAHLKPGHIPPEHKMESFIRSKYETRRWAMEGPLPEPESLDGGDNGSVSAPSPPPASSSRAPAASSAAPAPRKQANAFDLLGAPPSSNPRSAPSPAALSSPSPPTPQPVTNINNGGGLFDLDFSTPAPAPTLAPKKDAKADILSLFSSAPYNQPQQPPAQQQQQQQHGRQQSFGSQFGGLNLGGGGGGGGQVDPWGNPVQTQGQQSPPVASPQGGSTWGAFEGFQSAAPQQQQQQQARPSTDLFGAAPAANVWGAAPPAAASSSDPFGDFSSGGGAGGGSGVSAKKDAFSDIWA
ncbi:hypothetical protein RQP46_001453 [Phenoliferia psychrophenolica]